VGAAIAAAPTTDPTGTAPMTEVRGELYARGTFLAIGGWSVRAIGSHLSPLEADTASKAEREPAGGFRGFARGEVTVGHGDRLQVGVHASASRRLALALEPGREPRSEGELAAGVFVRVGTAAVAAESGDPNHSSYWADLSRIRGR
jgi:hypothetical protein